MITNLLIETLQVMAENCKKAADVVCVIGVEPGEPYEVAAYAKCTWEQFARVAATHKYDSGYGSQEISPSLRIVGSDWWMERHEYDGSEWWEFKRQPDVASIPYGKVCIDNIEMMPDMPSYVLGSEEEDDE